jgi:hypothetical protein
MIKLLINMAAICLISRIFIQSFGDTYNVGAWGTIASLFLIGLIDMTISVKKKEEEDK